MILINIIREYEAGWTFTRTERTLEIRRGGRLRFNEPNEIEAALGQACMPIFALGLLLFFGILAFVVQRPAHWDGATVRGAALGLSMCLGFGGLILFKMRSSVRDLRLIVHQIRQPVILDKGGKPARRVVVTARQRRWHEDTRHLPLYSILLEMEDRYDPPLILGLTLAESTAISRRMAEFLEVPRAEIAIDRDAVSPPFDIGMPRLTVSPDGLRCRQTRASCFRLMWLIGRGFLLMGAAMPAAICVALLMMAWVFHGARAFNPMFWATNATNLKPIFKIMRPVVVVYAAAALFFLLLVVLHFHVGFVLDRRRNRFRGSRGSFIALDAILGVRITPHQGRGSGWWTVRLDLRDDKFQTIAHLSTSADAEEVARTFATFLDVPIIRDGADGVA